MSGPTEFNLQATLDSLKGGETIAMPQKWAEVSGPVVIRRPVTLDGRESTISAPSGPVLLIDSAGVRIRSLQVVLESDGEDAGSETGAAIQVSSGTEPEFDEVEVKGQVAGLTGEEGVWCYPRSLQLGHLEFGRDHEFRLRLVLPAPCEIRSEVADVDVTPAVISSPGFHEIRITVGRIPYPDALLQGSLFICTSRFRRRIKFGAQIAAPDARVVTPVAGVGQVVWEAADWGLVPTKEVVPDPPPPPPLPEPVSITADPADKSTKTPVRSRTVTPPAAPPVAPPTSSSSGVPAAPGKVPTKEVVPDPPVLVDATPSDTPTIPAGPSRTLPLPAAPPAATSSSGPPAPPVTDPAGRREWRIRRQSDSLLKGSPFLSSSGAEPGPTTPPTTPTTGPAPAAESRVRSGAIPGTVFGVSPRVSDSPIDVSTLPDSSSVADTPVLAPELATSSKSPASADPAVPGARGSNPLGSPSSPGLETKRILVPRPGQKSPTLGKAFGPQGDPTSTVPAPEISEPKSAAAESGEGAHRKPSITLPTSAFSQPLSSRKPGSILPVRPPEPATENVLAATKKPGKRVKISDAFLESAKKPSQKEGE